MSDIRKEVNDVARQPISRDAPLRGEVAAAASLRVLPVLMTLLVLGVAGVLAWAAWQRYMAAPWTRDGTVRAYVVTVSPEVAGRIVNLPVADNQFVHKGDLLMTIDQEDYAIAVDQAQATVNQARANADNLAREAERRAHLTNLEITEEEKQTYAANARAAEAAYQAASANLARAKLDLERTTIRSPVNGYITNLAVQLGEYVSVAQSAFSLVNTDSFWVDGYFEETALGAIREGDSATIKLMGYQHTLRGHVDSVARGIAVANAQANQTGLAQVNPIFTWVRLAQRVPVRIAIDHVPEGVRLVQGQTASIQIDPRVR
jgi:multidrug resistance efflux pump